MNQAGSGWMSLGNYSTLGILIKARKYRAAKWLYNAAIPITFEYYQLSLRLVSHE